MPQVQEPVDWSALQSLCHRRLLALHQRQQDSRGTLRSLRWAVALLQRFNAFEPALPRGSTSPLYGIPSKNDGSGSEFKRKAACQDDLSSSTGKKARQQVRLVGGSGEAGFRTAKTIEARLALPHIFVLTKFVSHCLLVSLDQQPITTEADEVMESDPGSWELNDTPVNLDWEPDGMDRTEDKTTMAGGLEKGMWLYKWLVKALLWVPAVDARGQGDLSVAPMDWLVAYLMLADPTGVIKVVIEDLASELFCSESRCSPIFAVYMRRISILEFTALRMPEHLRIFFSSSLPLSSATRFKFAEEAVFNFEELRMSSADCLASCTPSIWLVLASISRCLLHAFTLLWVPCDKSASEIWLKLLRRCEGTTNLFPQISEVFEDPKSEELQGVSSWVCALLKARLVELTPLAADIVVILYSTAQSLKLQMDENLADISCQLLEVILGQLAQYLLRNCLGSHSLNYEGPFAELEGPALFLGNLKHNVYRLWDAILDASVSCICPSCDGVRSDFFALIDPSKILCCCHRKKGTPRKLKGDCFEHPCWRKAEATFSEICQLVIMCCEDHVVTDLLVQAMANKFCESGDMEAGSLNQVHTIMNVVQVLVAQGSRQHVVKAWAIKLRRLLPASNNEQILSMMSSLKLLLLPDTWKKHLWASKVISGRLSLNEDNDCGLAWKSAWQLVQKVLDCEWHTFITLLDRHKAWDMKWSVLNVLQLLPVDIEAQSQGVILRLRSAIRVFFSLLQERDNSGYGLGNSNQWRDVFGNQWWHYIRITEQLKELIIDHAAIKFSCFVLMVDNMLDFSFVLSGLKKNVTAILPQQSTELGHILQFLLRLAFRGHALKLVYFCEGERLKPLSLKEDSIPELTPSWFRQCGMTFPDFDKEGSQRSLQITKQGACRMTTMVANELGSLLRRTLEKGMHQARELHPCDCWPSHPPAILATIIMSRLETPHEMPMTMEQYEEVLPRHVSSPRHTYLMECFNKNPLLFEILQMIFEHGGSQEATKCAELLRALLADCITQFHNTFRPRQPFSAAVQGADLEILARMEVSRLIQVVWSSGWLPESLACSKEIVHVIDRVYIPDLLLLVWRCMHDSLAASAKKALEQEPSVAKDRESWKDGWRDGWEVSFQSILRHNIVQVCAHVGHVYPGRK